MANNKVLVEHPEAGNPPGLVGEDWFNYHGRRKGWVRVDTTENLSKKTVDELYSIAAHLGRPVPANAKKADIVKVLAGDTVEPTQGA